MAGIRLRSWGSGNCRLSQACSDTPVLGIPRSTTKSCTA